MFYNSYVKLIFWNAFQGRKTLGIIEPILVILKFEYRLSRR